MLGLMHFIDWSIIVAYIIFALWVGVRYAGRAGQNVNEYFLSGRSLPWWVAGTSMVATSFAADTPLLITGWVREDGIWKNWAWWCYAVAAMFQVFLFARWWRRSQVMTKAELVELRYGGVQAKILRGVLGIMHAFVSNTMVLCWVLLAAAKISEVLFEVDKTTGLALACVIAMSYSLMAGFWGVVVTDMLQFVFAMVGAIALAWISWSAVGGSAGIAEAVASGVIDPRRLEMIPASAEGGGWSAPLAAFFIYLGFSWWAAENVDGSGVAIQRIAASKDARHGMLALLWFNIAHYAMRPWCWILVGLASLVAIPHLEINAPLATGEDARVVEVREADAASGVGRSVVLESSSGERIEVALDSPDYAEDWFPRPVVQPDPLRVVRSGDVLAATDHEHAYMVMMLRYLPMGLLGIVAASLMAAFMSTIDTHVNLAASFFVNDIYKRFLKPQGSDKHYVLMARLASVVVLLIGTLFANLTDSIRDLFIFFLAFLGGLGPIYILRWVWWRITALTEIAAMLTSALTSTLITLVLTPPGQVTAWYHTDFYWSLGVLSDQGQLTGPGRALVVTACSMLVALGTLLLSPRPDPESSVEFYRRTRPIGFWGPVRALCPEVQSIRGETLPAIVGSLGGIGMLFGLTLGIGFALLDQKTELGYCALTTLAGSLLMRWAYSRLSMATEKD